MNPDSGHVASADPELSVVIAIIEGGNEAVETCLTALKDGTNGIRLECLVPFDARVRNAEELAERFPWATFIDARNEVSNGSGNSSREHHDALRAIGLRDAKAPVIALLEDHGTPCRNWAEAVLDAHRNSNAGVIGGAVENGFDRILNWAVYYCDFGRYQNPVPETAVEFASDSNVSYKRAALYSAKNIWYESFHETSVHWELQRRGERIILDPQMVVYQTRRNLRFFSALKERFVWGRSFAGTRAAEVSELQRLAFAVLSFSLPFLLTTRILKNGISKARHLGKLLLSTPLIFLLQVFWATGEFVGYVTRQAEGRPQMKTKISHDTL